MEKSITLKQFMDFINENITSDEEQQRIVLRYFLTEFKGTRGESISSDVEPVLILEQCDNLFVPQFNIYVNIKKTTIFIIACIFDVFLTRGFAVGIGTITGYIEKALHSIKPENACLFSRIAYYDKYFSGCTIEMLEKEYNGACNSIVCKRCPHRGETGNCNMNQEKIVKGLNALVLSKTIVADTENVYHLN